MVLVNDVLPEGGVRLVLREPRSGRSYAAERPKDWTREDEEQYFADFRRRFVESGAG